VSNPGRQVEAAHRALRSPLTVGAAGTNGTRSASRGANGTRSSSSLAVAPHCRRPLSRLASGSRGKPRVLRLRPGAAKRLGRVRSRREFAGGSRLADVATLSLVIARRCGLRSTALLQLPRTPSAKRSRRDRPRRQPRPQVPRPRTDRSTERWVCPRPACPITLPKPIPVSMPSTAAITGLRPWPNAVCVPETAKSAKPAASKVSTRLRSRS
jgi:hypothetical protein